MLKETTEDLLDSHDYAPTHHCPFLMQKNLGNPYQRDKVNIEETQRALTKYLYEIGLIKVGIHQLIFRTEPELRFLKLKKPHL